MSIAQHFELIRKRKMNLQVFRSALKFEGLPSQNQWAVILEKLSEANIPLAEKSNRESKLKKIYLNNIDFGDKAVQFAQFANEKKYLFDVLHSQQFSPDFSPTGPLPHNILDSELHSLPNFPALIKVKSNDTGTIKTFYFYSREIHRTREAFNVAEMHDLVSVQRFAGFSTVYGFKEEEYLRIDTIVVDVRKLTIEFRVDATEVSSVDRVNDLLGELKARFRKLMQESSHDDWGSIEFPLVNIYSKIEDMYNSDIGEIAALGYNTEAGAVNFGHMRGSGDLKEDPSHLASMEASSTDIFYITKKYLIDETNIGIRLTIPGKTSDVGAPEPKFHTAIIENCFLESQFTDMISLLK